MLYTNWLEDKDNEKMKTARLHVIEQLSNILKGEISDIESINVKELQWLDAIAGIDFIANVNNNIFGIASRIQWVDGYDTFTIRIKRCTGSITEKEKRIYAIKHGFLYPKFTTQWYFDFETVKPISWAIISTKDLFYFIDEYPDLVHKNISDNEFEFVYWRDIKAKNINIVMKKIRRK